MLAGSESRSLGGVCKPELPTSWSRFMLGQGVISYSFSALLHRTAPDLYLAT